MTTFETVDGKKSNFKYNSRIMLKDRLGTARECLWPERGETLTSKVTDFTSLDQLLNFEYNDNTILILER